jgi:hypothetical protein
MSAARARLLDPAVEASPAPGPPRSRHTAPPRPASADLAMRAAMRVGANLEAAWRRASRVIPCVVPGRQPQRMSESNRIVAQIDATV